MINPIALCVALLSPYNAQQYNTRLDTCTKVVQSAVDHELDAVLMVSIGWVESGMLPNIRSNRGAIGPLQILPRYFCPKRRVRGCDTIDAGMRAFKAWRKHFPKLEDTLCHYNGGWKCSKASRGYARKVLKIRDRLKSL